MSQTLKLTLEGAANALALNKDGTQVVIAGRNVFKMFNVDETEFVELCNLRVGKNINLNFSCNDVAWNTTDDNILATAATNGAVVIWNLNKPTRSKQEHVFNDHKRTVNKVSFKPTDPSLLLSGSQDGTMKCFDLRIKDVVRTFNSTSESVRDVQFSPHSPNLFTSVSETGNVQLWDLRRTDRFSLQFTAHSGPIFACDWHSDMKWLATASRDKTIKVWDMEVKPTLEFTINTLASIGHIKWRPNRRFHIASCALVVDCNINVWDVRRPYVPFAAFDHHKDVATGIAWRGSPHVFLSTSRDCSLVQNIFAEAKRPADAANPQGVSISGKGDILLASRIGTGSRKSKNEQFIHACSSLQTFIRCDQEETEGFLQCARRYVLSGRPLPELCDINAAVARSLKRLHVALVWETIKTLYVYTPPVEETIFSRPDDLLLPEGKVGNKVVSSCDASEEKSLRGMDTSAIEEDIDLEDYDFVHGNRHPGSQAHGDFFFGDGEMDPFNAEQLDAPPRFQPDWTVKAEAFVARHEIMEGAPPEPYAETVEQAPPADVPIAALTIHSVPTLPPLRFGELVTKALWHHADLGDVQTVVAVLCVIGDRRRDLDIPTATQSQWLLSYLDLLGRHRLFPQAAELIQISWLPSVNQMSQQSTTMYSMCGLCSKPLTRCGWLCDRCRSTTACVLCHQVVRGLLVWCQGCGHGGHIAHLAKWFQDNKLCPSGCGHSCEYD